MAIAPGIYNTGTATVASGGLTVSFQGVANLQAAIRPGDRFGGHVGFGIRIAAVGTDTVTLAHPWPGAAQTAAPYEIVFTPYDLSYREELYEIIKRYGRGALPAMAELVGEDGAIPVFTGPQTMSLLTQQDITNGAKYNVQVANLIERGNYNNEPAGFAVLVGDVGDGRAAIYSRVGPAGNWSAPAYITGPAITLDITEVDEVPYGAPPDATLTPKSGGYDLAFEIPRGMIIEPGTTTTLAPGQPAQVNFVPITGGYRLDISLPKGDTGEITGLTPFWQTRVSTDTNDTEAQTGLGATATGRALFTAANAGVAVRTLGLAGEVVMLPGATIPSGRRLLKLNGASLSRTTYADLWAYAQASGILAASEGAKTPAQFGPGNGSSTFTLPDWRGYFIRALDDGRGIDVGRVISAIQAQATEQHQHELPFGFDGSVTWPAIFDPSIGVPIYGSTTGSRPRTQGTHPGAATTGATRIAYSSTAVERSGETRPINLAALFAIRF